VAQGTNKEAHKGGREKGRGKEKVQGQGVYPQVRMHPMRPAGRVIYDRGWLGGRIRVQRKGGDVQPAEQRTSCPDNQGYCPFVKNLTRNNGKVTGRTEGRQHQDVKKEKGTAEGDSIRVCGKHAQSAEKVLGRQKLSSWKESDVFYKDTAVPNTKGKKKKILAATQGDLRRNKVVKLKDQVKELASERNSRQSQGKREKKVSFHQGGRDHKKKKKKRPWGGNKGATVGADFMVHYQLQTKKT